MCVSLNRGCNALSSIDVYFLSASFINLFCMKVSNRVEALYVMQWKMHVLNFIKLYHSATSLLPFAILYINKDIPAEAFCVCLYVFFSLFQLTYRIVVHVSSQVSQMAYHKVIYNLLHSRLHKSEKTAA